MANKNKFLAKIIKFSEETTLHGFPMIFPRHRHLIERIFWLVMVLAATLAAMYLAFTNLDRFNANPTVVSIKKDFRNWMNPLPAVTGCLKIRADGDLMDELIEALLWVLMVILAGAAAAYLAFTNLEHYNANPTVVSIQKDFRNWMNPLPAVTGCLSDRSSEKLTNELILLKWKINDTDPKFDYYFQFLKLVTNMTFANLKLFSKYENDESLNNENLLELADKVHPRITGILVTSETEGTIKNGLTYIYTEKGICFSINSNYSKFMSYPTTLSTESTNNLTTSIYCHYLNGLCYARFDNSPVSDVNYYIHSPMDTVHGTLSPSLVLHLSEELEVNFRMQETRSAQALRRLNPKQRQCRFSDEPLNGAPFFSTSMCYMECRARLSMELCGCIPQYYHFLSVGKTCDIKGLVCLSNHSTTLTKPPTKLGCNCPQPCNIVTYFSETPKSTKWKSGYFDQRMTFRWGLLPPTTRFYRDVLFSFEDLVVSIGGTVALFLGISFLTAVEVIFFILENILSLCFPNKSGKHEKLNVKIATNKSDKVKKPRTMSNFINVQSVENRNVTRKDANRAPPDYDTQFIAFNNKNRYSNIPQDLNLNVDRNRAFYNNLDNPEANSRFQQRLTLYSHNNLVSHIPFRH